ncbi:hypothetical protein [Brevibacterium antiquum]|nr:hypothetical protein [Brevibacterium antiquum]SMX78761.1 hypothetical protein BANT10_01289 [Brevibacterium antiquum]
MHVIEDLNDYLQSNPTMPSIYDPASTGRDFRERWDQDGCSNFRAQILHYATKMREAYDAETVNDSVAAWQDAFGPSFNKPAVEAAQKSLPAEQFIDTMLRIPIRLENRVTLFGRVRRAGVVRA